MKVIGISGTSGSGKTTISNKLVKNLPNCKILRQDWYFIDPEYCEPNANFCNHRYLHINEFTDHFNSFINDKTVHVPIIDYSTFTRKSFRKTIKPGDFLIVEGMTIFRIKNLIDKYNLAIYLAPDMDTIKIRKRNRDIRERNKTDEIIEIQLNWIKDDYSYDLENMDVRIAILRECEDLEEVTQSILNLIEIL